MDFEFWMVRVFELQFGPFFCSRIWRLCCARPLTWPFQITQNYTCSDGILHDLTYTSERFRALLTPTKIPYLWNKIVAPVTIYVQHTDRHPSTHTHKYFVHLFDIGIQLLLQVCLSLSLSFKSLVRFVLYSNEVSSFKHQCWTFSGLFVVLVVSYSLVS